MRRLGFQLVLSFTLGLLVIKRVVGESQRFCLADFKEGCSEKSLSSELETVTTPPEDNDSMPTVLVTNKNGKLEMNPDALAFLKSIDEPLVVVAVCGPARTGKSFLLNRLAGVKKGFSLGSTVQSHTKGIWMWSRPHPRRAGHRLLLLDTEGIGDPEKGDEGNDNMIISLAVLLSSLFIYNNQGSIDQRTLGELQFITELSKRIQVRTQGKENGEREFVRFFPDFVWVVRDFTLDKVIDGKLVTSDEYLEHTLKLREDEKSLRDQNFNAVRRSIRNNFPSRHCFTLPPPAHFQDSRRFGEMEEEELEPNFRREFQAFSDYVHGQGRVKSVLGGHLVTGRRLAHLLQAYVREILEGKLPVVDQGVKWMAQRENTEAVEAALAYYNGKLSKLLQLPPNSLYTLPDLYTYYHQESVKIFTAQSIMDDSGQYIKELEERLQSRYKIHVAEIEKKSQGRCESILAEVTKSVKENLSNSDYVQPGGYEQLNRDLSEATGRYKEATKNEAEGSSVLHTFLERLKPELDHLRKVQQGDASVLEEELLRLEAEKESREREKQESQKRTSQEWLNQLEHKFVKERAGRLRELEEAAEQKRAEGERYKTEGSFDDGEKAWRESERFQEEHKQESSWTFWDYLKQGVKFIWFLVQSFYL